MAERYPLHVSRTHRLVTLDSYLIGVHSSRGSPEHESALFLYPPVTELTRLEVQRAAKTSVLRPDRSASPAERADTEDTEVI